MGRATGLPYHLAEMGVTTCDTVHYVGTRHGARRPASYDLRLAPGMSAAEDPLDTFLTARWSAYVSLGSHLVRYDVSHQRWPLRTAAIRSLRESMLTSVGVNRSDAAPIAHYAAGVDANLAPRSVFLSRCTGRPVCADGRAG